MFVALLEFPHVYLWLPIEHLVRSDVIARSDEQTDLRFR